MYKKSRSVTTVKSMTRNKASLQDAYKIRRWILAVVSKAGANGGLTLNYIKKYLDSKVNGLSNRPEVKIVLKRAIETGHIVKVDGRYMYNVKPAKKLSPESSAVIKVLEEALERGALVDATDTTGRSAEVKKSSRNGTTQTENRKQVAPGGRDGSASAQIDGHTGFQEATKDHGDSPVPVGDLKAEKAKKKRKIRKRATDGDVNVFKSIGENGKELNEMENTQMSYNKALHGGGDAVTASDASASDQAAVPKKKRSRSASVERN